MRDGAAYAKQVKRYFNRLKRSGPKPAPHEFDDPLKQLMFAVLSEDISASKAKAAVSRLVSGTIDYNDLRVSTPTELAGMISSDIPDALSRATSLAKIFGAIYERENAVTLDALKAGNRKDARAYLGNLAGMTPYALASTMLWIFGDHVIPVDEQILETLKKEEIIDPETRLEEAQAFLKRHVGVGEARMFTALVKRHAAQRTSRTTSSLSTRKTQTKKTTPT